MGASVSSTTGSSSQPAPEVLILGIGNILLSDEGAGIKALDAFRERYSVPENIEIVDGGTMGVELLSGA